MSSESEVNKNRWRSRSAAVQDRPEGRSLQGVPTTARVVNGLLNQAALGGQPELLDKCRVRME